jgi:uncharacterized protein YecE (DUF72 family)
MAQLPHFGPAGWTYADWLGVVYPKPRPRGVHALDYLARFCDAVEINATFYQPLRPEIAVLWMKKVEHNPRFLFTAKLMRRFTHERFLIPSEIATFKEGLRPLARAGRLGCLLMQFPWSFRFTAENREYFIKMRRTFHEYPLVAEMRHSSWLCDEAIGTFIDYRVGFCNIDQPIHASAMPPTALLTSPVGYVRLHGRAAGNWFDEFDEHALRIQSTDYLYSRAELQEWYGRIEQVSSNAEVTFVVANNDAKGQAMVNILEFQSMFGREPRIAPPELLRLYPTQLEGFSANQPMQQELFAGLPARNRAA